MVLASRESFVRGSGAALSPPNLLPLLGVILAGFLASFFVVREPALPEASALESPLVLEAQDTGIAQLVPQTAAGILGTAIGNSSEPLAERRATSFIGRKIDSRDGDRLGKIEDLVLDEADRVTHAIVSFGGVGGLGAKQVVVPWQTLKDATRDARIVLERAQLEAAPALTANPEIQ